MPQETHIKTNTRKILLVIIFILVIGFGFGKGEKVVAADETLGTCSYRCPGASEEILKEDASYTATQCQTYCEQTLCNGKKPAECFITVDGILWDTKEYVSVAANLDKNNGTVGKIEKITTAKSSDYSCTSGELLDSPLDCILLALLNLMVWLMESAASLFEWIMKPENITSVINNNSVYNAWTMVRDVLNVSFIMFLLFSAFATVFQIDKYNYKKTLLWIVIMALLVNFSFPISRFIIDVSNMMMFYFADALGINGARTMVDFAGAAKLPEIIHNEIGSVDSTYLLAAVIFVFIFAVTIVTITVLFVLRTIALAILIIFSSLAFVGAAIPQLSSYASDWWKKLFNYAFFGPIMLFMMYIASGMMTEIGKSGMGSMQKIAAGQTDDPSFIASISFFVLPIVILWMGLGVAQSMSAVGASAVVGKAQGLMKGAGKWTATAPWSVAKMSGIPGGAQAGWKNFRKTGNLFGGKIPGYGGSDAQEARESKFGGLFKEGGKGWTDAKIELERTRANELRKKWKDQGAIDKDSVYKKLETGNSTEQKAAALEIAENHSFESFEQFKKASTAIGNDPVFKKIFDDKAKEKHINFIIRTKIEEEEKKTGKTLDNKQRQDIYDENLDKLDNKKLASQINLDPNKDSFFKEYVNKNFLPYSSAHQDIFKNLKGGSKKQWADAGLAPTDKRNSTETSQSTKSHEEIQREMKQKNQEKMDSENEFKQSHEDIQRERAKKAQEEINKQNI